jgi:hypothetical protein
LDARACSPPPASRKSGLSAWSVLQSIFVVVALTASGAAAAQTQNAAAPATSQASSDKDWPTDFRFDADRLDLNIYGLAYHPDREKVKRENLDNQVNPGLGLHYELTNSERGITFTELGAYYDSGRNWAKFLSLGYQFKLGENWKFGGAVAAMHSNTYNKGVAFVGMFPLVTYDLGPVKLNAVYFPKVANYNEVAAFGFYISIPMGQWLGDSAKR